MQCLSFVFLKASMLNAHCSSHKWLRKHSYLILRCPQPLIDTNIPPKKGKLHSLCSWVTQLCKYVCVTRLCASITMVQMRSLTRRHLAQSIDSMILRLHRRAIEEAWSPMCDKTKHPPCARCCLQTQKITIKCKSLERRSLTWWQCEGMRQQPGVSEEGFTDTGQS